MAKRLDPAELEARIQQGDGKLLPRPYISMDHATFVNIVTKARFVDSTYGEWWVMPASVLSGAGHKKRFTESNKKGASSFLTKYNGNGGLVLDESTFDGMKTKAKFTDQAGNEHWLLPSNVLHRAKKTKHNKLDPSQVQYLLADRHDKVSLDESTYQDTHKPAKFIDPDFGEWWAPPCHVIRGSGHPKRAGNAKYTAAEVITHIQREMPFVSMDESTYRNVNIPASFVDEKFGQWKAKPADVMRGHGHVKRGHLKTARGFAEVAEKIRGVVPFVELVPASYSGVSNLCLVVDQEFGEYEAKPRHLLDGIGLHQNRICTKLETAMSELLGVQRYDKKISSDFPYRPDFRITDSIFVDVDGLYWHSYPIAPKGRHIDKCKYYHESGFRLFQVREDELRDKPVIVKSLVNHALGKSKVLFARKLKLAALPTPVSKQFFLNNHLMGNFSAPTMALVDGDVVLAAMSYRLKNGELTVIRFCNLVGHSVVGGFTRILKRIVDNVRPTKVVSHVDLRYGVGNSLIRSGFEHAHTTLGWKWTDFKHTYNRLKCRANMDARQLTEAEHAEELGWSKIYDAGQAKYEWLP